MRCRHRIFHTWPSWTQERATFGAGRAGCPELTWPEVVQTRICTRCGYRQMKRLR